MRVTEKAALNFVHFGEDSYSNINMLKNMAYVYWGLVYIMWVPYLVAARGLVFCIVLTILALIYSVAFCILKSSLVKKTYKLRFLTNSVSFLFLYVFFYLFTIFFINVTDAGSTLWQDIELTVCFVLFPILSLLFTLRAIKANIYDREKPKKQNGSAAYLGTGAIGVLLGRITEPLLTQSQAISVIVILVELLLLLFSLAAPSILRMYYAYKFNIEESVEGESISPLLCFVSQRGAKRILGFLLKVVIFAFAAASLFGISQVA